MKARFLLPARRELNEAVRYYNAQRVRLGEEFRDEAWETVRRIKEFPLLNGKPPGREDRLFDPLHDAVNYGRAISMGKSD
ncbi:MAG: hypothetical protein ACREA9_09230 [Pyrinomonadaceae bacterium]